MYLQVEIHIQRQMTRFIDKLILKINRISHPPPFDQFHGQGQNLEFLLQLPAGFVKQQFLYPRKIP